MQYIQYQGTIATAQFQEVFFIPKEMGYSLSSRWLFPVSSVFGNHLICFLSPCICLFWIFLINGITEYVSFHVCFHGSAVLHAFLCQKLHCIEIPHFVYPFMTWQTFVVLPLTIVCRSAMNIVYKFLYGHRFSFLLADHLNLVKLLMWLSLNKLSCYLF